MSPIRVAGWGAWIADARGIEAVREALREGAPRFTALGELSWRAEAFAPELPDDAPPPAALAATVGEPEVDYRALRLPPLSVARMHAMEKVALVAASDALEDAGFLPRAGPHERARVYFAASTLGPDPRTDHGPRIRRHELAHPVAEAFSEIHPERAAELSEYVDALFNLVAPPIEPDSMMSSASILAGRICNLFDLRGGHLAIDASASSSLAALEAATADLRAGVCDVALVCAASSLISPSAIVAMAHRGLLGGEAPRPLSAASRGALLGEGAVAFVLDRGASPRREARGWIGSVGEARVPPRGPDRLQAAVAEAARAACERAGRAPRDVAFVASRAAGVPTVDREEAAALSDLFGAASRPSGLSVACHAQVFGHLGAASGALALLHALLTLEEGATRSSATPIDADLAPGLRVGGAEVFPSDAVAAVADAGLSATAYVALVAAPDAHRDTPSVAPVTAGRMATVPLAITGMGVQAPGASDVPTFWANIRARVESIRDLPSSRFDVDRLIDASEELGPILQTRLAAPVDLPPPDPARFRLSPAALAELDPAIRLVCAAADEALADAGGAQRWTRDRVAVVAGQLSLRWSEVELEKRMLFASHLVLVRTAMLESGFDDETVARVISAARARFDARNPRVGPRSMGARTSLECAAHVARIHGLGGPVLAVDAACASSLAAVERAAHRLAAGEVDAAVAAGVAFNLSPEYYIVLSILGALSPQGAPPFHAGADGFVPGEGAGAVVLERLDDAVARGARIHAVIRAIGVSSDGAGLSIFAPNAEGEGRAIRRALEHAAWTPASVDLVEAHGTGTRLGDETELQTYAAAYGDRDPGAPLTVGTVKSQIGHLSSAAGMVGLVKAALAVREGILPPSLGDQPDPALEQGPLRLPATEREWVRSSGARRRAGVSAFGLGGVNYHLLLEEHAPPPDVAPAARAQPQALLPARGPLADRFEVELVPCGLDPAAPRRSLAGRAVLILRDRGALHIAVGAALEARGVRVVLSSEGEAPPVDGLIDLSLFGRPDDRSVSTRATEAVQRALSALRPSYDQLAETAPGDGFYVACTSLGGDLGLSGDGAGDRAGAALLGLAKGLKQELPGTASRGVDFDPDEDPEVVADVLLRELEAASDQLEVAWAGRRLIPRLARLPLEEEPPIRAVTDEDVVVISGGGRGVVFECAMGLARLGARVVVTGRTAPPPLDAPWRALDEDAFQAFGREHMLTRRGEDPSLGALAIKAEVDAMARQRELAKNLDRAARAGLPLTYAACDVTDRAALDDLVARVREEHGPITGVVHGAMVQWSTLASRKEPAKVAATMAVKCAALTNLVEATREEPLRVVMAFGSGAGRFGNRGQADYCAANALMAAQVAEAGQLDRRGARWVTVDWTAWDSVGAAVEDADLTALLRATGITSISVEEGVFWFLREWTSGRSDEVVVFEERMLHDWPFLGRQAERAASGPVEEDDLGRPLVPGAWPLVDRVLHREPGAVTVERCFSVDGDGFVAQHTLHGVPILPATFGCELLAEAAALAAPGSEIARAEHLRIETPAKLFRGDPLVLRTQAIVEPSGAIRSESRSRLTLRGRELTERVHHAGRFHVRPAGSARPERLSIEPFEGAARARSFFHGGCDPVLLGPLYSRAEWIQLGDGVVIGTIRAPRQRDITARTSWPLFCVDPLLMDTAFQIAANWDGLGAGYVSIPYGVEELVVGRPRGRAEGARARARVVRVDDPDVYLDVDVASEDGWMLLRMRGVHLRRIGPVPRE